MGRDRSSTVGGDQEANAAQSGSDPEYGAYLVARGLRSSRRIDFHGRSVVITGGSRGLGLLIARQLAAEGARLTLAARDQAELDRAREELAAQGADVTAVVCDVGIREDAERLIQDAISRTGTIDVLINNAGIIQVGPLEHMTHEDFEQAMAVHFWGPLHTILAAIPAMRRHGAGRIVNISSIGGKIGVPHPRRRNGRPHRMAKQLPMGSIDADASQRAGSRREQ
jgi:NAD(P)-dependent dehydrogenase (short-subunit alcohol dehydrogenase family)